MRQRTTSRSLPLPVQRVLRALGQDMRDARLRRRIPTAIMAERASISRTTLNKVEKGDPGVSLGIYATVLFVLGLSDRLGSLADIRSDTVGLELEEERGEITGSVGPETAGQTFPLEVIYLRDDDIPQYVEDGVAHIGIVGENEYAEKACQVDLIERLGYSSCRLSIAIPKSLSFANLEDLNDKRIATSYPNILESYLREHGIKADIHVLSGSVELAPSIGMADAIFDIVSSGSTLISNGLKEVEVVMKSEAVIIANRNLEEDIQAILNDLIFRIRSVLAASNNKYILLNAPSENLEQIIETIPGMKNGYSHEV